MCLFFLVLLFVTTKSYCRNAGHINGVKCFLFICHHRCQENFLYFGHCVVLSACGCFIKWCCEVRQCLFSANRLPGGIWKVRQCIRNFRQFVLSGCHLFEHILLVGPSNCGDNVTNFNRVQITVICSVKVFASQPTNSTRFVQNVWTQWITNLDEINWEICSSAVITQYDQEAPFHTFENSKINL